MTVYIYNYICIFCFLLICLPVLQNCWLENILVTGYSLEVSRLIARMVVRIVIHSKMVMTEFVSHDNSNPIITQKRGR